MSCYSDRHMRYFEKGEITCHDIQRLFLEYVEGDLPQSLSARVVEHVTACAKCQEFEATYRMVPELAKEIKERFDTPIDDGVRARLRRALRERGIPVRE